MEYTLSQQRLRAKRAKMKAQEARRRRVIRFLTISILCAISFSIGSASVKQTPKQNNTSPLTEIKIENEKIVVAVDPGHGGKDIGAEGIVNESEMIEKTSQYLYDLLSRNPRFQPFLTREIDLNGISKLLISERIEKANTQKAQLLISIHGNSDPVGAYRGFECFASPPGRKNHKESLRFASIIAEKMGDAGHKLRGENGVRYLYYVEDENGKSIVDLREFNYKNTGRKDPTLGMVEKPEAPSVLVEQCFINNKEDYQEWGNDSGCYKAARIYYEAICEYFGIAL